MAGVFLGEGNVPVKDPLGMGTAFDMRVADNDYNGSAVAGSSYSDGSSLASSIGSSQLGRVPLYDGSGYSLPTPASSLNSMPSVVGGPMKRDSVYAVTSSIGHDHDASVKEYVEVWSYASGLRFRGFVAERTRQPPQQRALFVFFDQSLFGKDLKKGLMALLELASSQDLDCEQLVACVERAEAPPAETAEESEELVRDLGWVGFEPATLGNWSDSIDIGRLTSEKWLFLAMDV